MPADTGVDDGSACRFYRLRQLHDFFMGGAVWHQINHRQPVDDNKISSHRRARAAHHFNGQAHAVFVRAAPLIGALVGMGYKELVQEIAFGAHDLDPVIACFLRALCAGHDIADLFLDPFGVQLGRRKGRYGGFHGRGGYAFRPVGITARVEDLHGDLAACLVHTVGHDAVVGDILVGGHHRCPRQHGAFKVGANAASDHKRHFASRPFRVKLCHTVPVFGFFQPCVHRAHEHAVLERGKAQIKRFQKMGVVGHAETSGSVLRPDATIR